MPFERYPVEFIVSYYNTECCGFFTVGAENGCLTDDDAYAIYDCQYGKSSDLLNNVKMISAFKKWVAGGSRTMLYLGKQEKVDGNLLFDALNRYAWNMISLAVRLLEQDLPIAFIDADKFVKEYSGLQTSTIDARYNIVSNFIAALANSTSKNVALLEKYGETLSNGSKYQSYNDYKDEMIARNKK